MTYINIYDLCRSYINILFQKKHKRIYTRTSFREPQPVKIDFGEPEQKNSIFYGKKKTHTKKTESFQVQNNAINIPTLFVLQFFTMFHFDLFKSTNVFSPYKTRIERWLWKWKRKDFFFMVHKIVSYPQYFAKSALISPLTHNCRI